jgi:hypothetical protein
MYANKTFTVYKHRLDTHNENFFEERGKNKKKERQKMLKNGKTNAPDKVKGNKYGQPVFTHLTL